MSWLRRLVLGIALAALLPAVAAAQSVEPIRGTAAAPPTLGRVATPDPVPAPAVPRHPFMADNERSNLHDDAYQTDAYARSGPLGRDVQVASAAYNGVCGSVTFDRQGRIITVCVGLDAITLRLLDPATLQPLAAYTLPPRPPGSGVGQNPFQNFTGGGYFYLDDHDRAVLPTSQRHVLAVGLASGAFEVERDVDLTGVVPDGDGIISVLPDWDGRLWFASRRGVIGTIGLDGSVHAKDFEEPIGNSFAVTEEGTYLVTDAANYKLRAGADGTPTVVWRTPYPNDGTQKPGQSQAGSGTTPTIMGPDLVAITDNADPISVLVQRRDDGRTVCSAPVFSAGASSDDQSLTTDGTALVAENNFGYQGPQSVTGGLSTTPGLARVDVDRAAGTCAVRWTSPETAPSVVPKLARGSGLEYTYTKPAGDPMDPWYLTALDWRTGETVYKVLAGSGPLFTNNYAPVTIGPDGTAYIGVLGGLVALRDRGGVDVPAAPHVPIAHPLIATPVPAPRRSRVAVRVRCARGATAVLIVTGSRIDRVRARGKQDARRPFRLRVRAGGRVRVTVLGRDGGHRVVRARTTRCR